MSLKDIYCQDSAVGRLQQAYSIGKMAHAYIFAGAEGVGKFTSAREWAKMLLCHNRIEKKAPDPFFDSCGECHSCTVFEGGGHPDFKPIYKELVKFTKNGKNKTTPVEMPKDVIDEFLIDKVAARPTMGEMAVYVVQEAQKLNTSSQNALLKVLEEPPRHCLIILLCSRVDMLLPTILSRCQLLRFGPVDEEIVVKRLTGMGIDTREAVFWARFSEGSVGDAISWAQLEPGKKSKLSCYQVKQQLVEKLARLELGDCLEFAEWLSAQSKEIAETWMDTGGELSRTDITRRAQKGLLRMIIAVFHDAMRFGAGLGDGLANADQESQIRAISSKFEPEKLADRVNKGYENIQWVDASVNEKLIFEELLLNYSDCAII